MPCSRSLFETACKAFARQRHDWAWVEHPVGYMHRTTPLQKPTAISDPSDLADDPATALQLPDHLTCHQSVVFSPTFQVPTFYFSVYDSSACDVQSPAFLLHLLSAGSPLGLSDIMHTQLLRKHALQGMETTPFSIGDPASNFPLLSFGDHPALGSQCWYLHPCQTGPAVEEILTAYSDARPWLEVWFLVLSSVVDLGE